MIPKQSLNKLSDYLWEIPPSFRSDMRVPARVYASERMLDSIARDRSLEQLVNVSTLPGIIEHAVVMPDAHEGYGFPIGGVAAFPYPDGIVSPGGIGYDINCGVRLLVSQLTIDEIRTQLEKLSQQFFRDIPSGLGRSGPLTLDTRQVDQVLNRGVAELIELGFGESDDPEHIESRGALPDADSDMVSAHAKNRGHDQLGTMGAGNHFVEIDAVEEIFDEAHASAFGLFLRQAVVLIHSGSRGLGHQVATDYIRTMLRVMPKYKIALPDRELACVPLSSPEGQSYLKAMAAAANFAWSNRQVITHSARSVWHKVFGDAGGKLTILYDVSHNIAKIEEHTVSGQVAKVIVHRKGATRAFPAGHPELQNTYRSVGQPVLIPGSMGTASYVLVGTPDAMTHTFGSSCHGAGRAMSRHAAKKRVRGSDLRAQLKKQGIIVQAGSHSGIAEEAPFAYKDVHDVVDIVHQAGIANKVARLKPQAVIKG